MKEANLGRRAGKNMGSGRYMDTKHTNQARKIVELRHLSRAPPVSERERPVWKTLPPNDKT